MFGYSDTKEKNNLQHNTNSYHQQQGSPYFYQDNFLDNQEYFDYSSSDLLFQSSSNSLSQKNYNYTNNQFEEDFNSTNQVSEQIDREESWGFSFPQGLNYQNIKPISMKPYSESTNADGEEEEETNQDECTIVAKTQPRELSKKISYATKMLQDLLPEKLLGTNRKFYLFIDQMIDLDYFKDLKRPDKFAGDNQQVQLTKGFRLTNQVIHRIDNKFIEIESELLDCHPESIDYIIQILQSIGNNDVLKYVMCLKEFKKNIQLCQSLIKQQSLDPNYIQHRLERAQAADDKFKEITSGLDPNKLIFYQRYSVNYEKQLYQSNKAGYSPALYEVIDNGSYSFKDYLSKNGFFDPMSQLFRLGDCFYRTCYFMGNLPQEFDENLNKLASLDLVTVDNFKFPVTMKLDHHYLETEYDEQNNLQMKFHDLLAVYEFNFKDPDALKNLQDIRKQSIITQQKLETIQGEDIDWNEFDYIQTQFFNKYYSDQVKNLVKKGNKWYKRCGFTEIPTKKLKK